MKSVIIASVVASAAAFAPAQSAVRTSVATNMGFDSELGAQAPLGFFDPLGLVSDGDQEKFDRLRYVEIKHGRVCQLAFLGQIVTRNGIHLPGDIDMSGHAFASYPNGIAALFGPDAIPTAGSLQMFAFVGFLELAVMKDIEGTGNEFVGDFRNGALDFGWDSLDAETQLSKRAIELNNGRAAQLGILGLMVHEKLGEIGMAVELPLIGTLA
jgi:hypothetical protein